MGEKRVIVPQYVDEPKPGKTLWSIKTTDGQRYGAQPHIARALQNLKGQECEVEVGSRDWQGKTYYSVERVFDNAKQVAAQGQAPLQTRSATSTTINQTEGMFVMAVLGKAFEGTGTVPGRAEMTAMVTSLVMSWRDAETDLNRIKNENTPMQRPPAEPGLDDEIAF